MNLRKFLLVALLMIGTSQITATLAATASNSTTVDVHGLSMDTILQRFGEPETKMAPVGDPPITRWAYPGFTVYFEHQLAIHAVKHRN